MYDVQSPCITVLMSVFTEEEEYLMEAIDSICKQTFRDFEFIIYDDCSNSKVKRILKHYEDMDERIHVIHNGINRGLTYNLVEGVKIAKGRYICRQDSDDISLPNRLELQLCYMESHKDIAVLGTGFFLYKNKDRKRRSFGLVNPEAIKARLFFENTHIMHSSVMIRKSFIDNHKLNYDCDFTKSQDYDLWTRISEYGKITILKKRLCLYRIHEQQISSNEITKTEQKKFFFKVIDRQLNNLGINPEGVEKDIHHNLVVFKTPYAMGDMIKWCAKLIITNNNNNKFHVVFFAMYCIKKLMIYTVKLFLSKLCILEKLEK